VHSVTAHLALSCKLLWFERALIRLRKFFFLVSLVSVPNSGRSAAGQDIESRRIEIESLRCVSDDGTRNRFEFSKIRRRFQLWRDKQSVRSSCVLCRPAATFFCGESNVLFGTLAFAQAGKTIQKLLWMSNMIKSRLAKKD
jgi:hypothetical protein